MEPAPMPLRPPSITPTSQQPEWSKQYRWASLHPGRQEHRRQDYRGPVGRRWPHLEELSGKLATGWCGQGQLQRWILQQSSQSTTVMPKETQGVIKQYAAKHILSFTSAAPRKVA